jgi:uncharacterized protein YdcH (DUF465 family)
MELSYLEHLFNQTNALSLLRERRAALLLSFLKSAFSDGRTHISQDELTQQLTDFMVQYGNQSMFGDVDSPSETESNLFDQPRQRARALLREWEDKEHRYLRGANNAQGQYEYSLTEHVVRAWQWIESIEQREFTGTRSRLDDIFEKIKRVVANSREKTDAERVAELRQQQLDIEAEIAVIESGKRPYRPFDTTRLREEYDGVMELISVLSADFKAVEGHFERIRTDMLRQTASMQGHKGALLGSALDARDALDRTPQGMSFNGFFEELRDPQRTNFFEAQVQTLLSILDDRQVEHTNDQRLRQLYRHLLKEAQPVLDANRRIADRVTRIVAENTSLNRQFLRQRISELKDLLLNPEFIAQSLQPNAEVWTLDTDYADIQLPLEKKLKTKSDTSTRGFARPEIHTDAPPPLPVMSETAVGHRLMEQIRAALSNSDALTLAQLLDEYPLQQRLAEALAYLNIAAQPNNRHFIDENSTEMLPLDPEEKQVLEGPTVFWVK